MGLVLCPHLRVIPFGSPSPFLSLLLLAECFANLFFIMYSGNRSLILVFHSYFIAEVRFLSVSSSHLVSGLAKARHQGKEEGFRLHET